VTDTNGDGIPDETQGGTSAYVELDSTLKAQGYTGSMVPKMGTPSGTPSYDPNDPNTWLIYLGDIKHYDSETPHHPSLTDYWQNVTHTPDEANISQMLDNLDHMSIKEQHKLYAQLLLAGYSSTTIDLDKIPDEVKNSAFADVASSYSMFLKELSSRYSTRNQKITPDQLLEQRIAYRFKAAGIDWNGDLDSLNLNSIIKLTGAENASLAGTRTATYTSKDFMDPMDAKALVRATLQRELGRDPTQAEYEDFISSIHAAEAHDMSSQSVTTTTDAQGRVLSQNSTSHAGMSQAGIGEMALERAQRQPDWAEWQAMGTYAPALYDALGPGVPGT